MKPENSLPREALAKWGSPKEIMHKLLRKIARIFIMEWSKSMQYRADIFLWMLAEAAIPLVSMAVWYAVARNSTTSLTPRDILTYYVLVIFIKVLTDAWGGFFIAEEILNGQIVKYLIKPFSYAWAYISNNLTEKVIKMVIPIPVLLIVFITWPGFFSPAIYTISNILTGLISLVLAIILAFVLDTIFGFFAFWIEDATELRHFKTILTAAASGVLIPLVLLPPTIYNALSFLPFRYIVSVPAEILMGQAQGMQAILLISAQVAWIGIFLIANKVLWTRGLKRYAIPGQ